MPALPTSLKLIVTAEDIAEALKRRRLSGYRPSKDCAVSVAATRTFGFPCTSALGNIYVHIDGNINNHSSKWSIPYAGNGVGEFQNRFDFGPLPEFEIEASKES